MLRRPHGTYAIRYAGIGDIRQVEEYYRLNKAQSIAEFRDTLRMQAIPATTQHLSERYRPGERTATHESQCQ